MTPKEEREYQLLLKRKSARLSIVHEPGKTAEEWAVHGLDPDVIDWLLEKEYIQFDGNLGLEAKPL